MKTVFVGGGQGCRAVLELVVQQRLATLSLEILAVVDVQSDAPGMQFARRQGWTTLTDLEEALSLPGLELVIELTGVDEVRDAILHRVPPQVRVMDHYMARVFWDLDEIAENLRDELQRKNHLEALLLEDRRRLQEIIDSLPDVVMVLNQEMRIEHVNQRFEEITDMNLFAATGQLCYESVCQSGHLFDCTDQNCPFVAVMEGGRPINMVQQKNCTSPCEQNDCYYEITANPIRDKSGKIVNVVITSREVTEQIHLKRETEVSARRFRQILATVHGLITIKDLRGRYQVVNPRTVHFFGFPQEEWLGRTARDLLPAEVAELFTRHDEELLEKKHHLSHEEVFFYQNKERTLISERILLTDYKGDPAGICCVSRDVTGPRQLQRELVQSEKHAAVGKLAAAVAHEINNPLTGILTFAEELYEDAPPDDPRRDDYEVILRETMRCRQIVKDLLDFSRQSKLNRQPLPINNVVQRALTLVQKQAPFHNIHFNLQLASHLPPVYGDPNQLQQVILNLIINARDAMDGCGEIVLRSFQEKQGKLVLEVHDQGCGISPDDLGQIFEPFFSTKGGQGNGLGLAAVSSIVEQHGGTIVVESALGEGSIFRLFLPSFKRESESSDSLTPLRKKSAPGPGEVNKV